MTTSLTFAHALEVETATLQAQFPDLADALSRAHALLVEGRLFPEDDGRTATVLSQDGTASYHVNGSCSCPASQFHNAVCKHRLGLRLYRKVADRLATEQDERWTVDLDPEVLAASTPVAIPAAYLCTIQGKPFIRFEGLLDLAHQRGLVEFTTTIVQVSPELAVCQSTARFQDGRTFTDIGDASPTNVAKHLAPHFIRMASTRASARALRRALNIAACAVEELGQEVAE
jgi:hypothetical protein